MKNLANMVERGRYESPLQKQKIKRKKKIKNENKDERSRRLATKQTDSKET